MNTASKRATAGTVTLSSTALAGGTNINSHEMELTMDSHITPAPGAATHTVHVAESRQRPLNPGEPMKFDTTLDGQPVVTRSTTPFFDTCRVMAAWGMTGRVDFRDAATGGPRMTMQIAAGANLTVEEGPTGPKVRKYRHAGRGEDGVGGESLPPDSQAAIDGLQAAIETIDALTDEERQLLDGVA